MSSKRIKSPSTGTKSPKSTGKSSLLVDQLLQERKSPAGKKLVLDLNSDNFLLTESPSTKSPSPDTTTSVVKPLIHKPPIETVVLRASPTLHHKSGRGSSSPVLNTESRSKLDQFSAIDSVIVRKESSSPVVQIPNIPPPAYEALSQPNSGLSAQGKTDTGDASVSGDTGLPVETKLKNVNEAIEKLQAKIKAKGRLDKYVKLLEQLEGKVKKYTKQIAAKSATIITSSNKPTTISQPTAHQNPVKNPIIPTISASGGPDTRKQTTQHPSTNPQQKLSVSPSAAIRVSHSDEIDNEIAQAQKALTNILQNNSGDTKLSGKPDRVTGSPTKKEGKTAKTIFGISSHIDSLKDKQLDLQHKQQELQDKYNFKLKQIDKLKSQHAEIKRLHALEAEKRKIYDMEQKLKRIEKEQWEEQQKIKRDLHKITVANIKPVYSGEFAAPIHTKSVASSNKQVAASAAAPIPASAASMGIFKYLADAWNKFAALPLGETVILPVTKPNGNGSVSGSVSVNINSNKTVETSNESVAATPTATTTVAENKAVGGLKTEPESPKPNMKEIQEQVETKLFKNKYKYRIAGEVTNDSKELDNSEWEITEYFVEDTEYILPFDDTWVQDNMVDLVYCQDMKNKIQDDYLKQNLRLRLITNLELSKPDRVFNRLHEFGIDEERFICMMLSALSLFSNGDDVVVDS